MKKSVKTFMQQVWEENPIMIRVLGICSTLAVTNLMKNTVVMCAALIFTMAFSNTAVSILRKWIPARVRMMVEILIIASSVIIVDIMLKAYLPDISRQLGPYVGLIITNCIVMGRTEAFGLSNPPHLAFADGVGAGIGYSFVLVLIALVREPLGSGSLWGIDLFGEGWENWTVMVMAPGAFFVLACIIWVAKWIKGEEDESESPGV